MTLTWRIAPEKLLDEVELGRVAKVQALFKLQDGKAIDSYSMSPNGPILESVFLANGRYFLEVSMTGKHLTFDAASNKLHNFRVTYGEHAQPPEVLGEAHPEVGVAPASNSEGIKFKEFVVVRLHHTDTLRSDLSYFGEDMDAWLSYVVDALPPDNLLP